MATTKITDLVDQSTIDDIKSLNAELQALLITYAATAKDLAKGIDIPIKNMADLEKLEKLYLDKIKDIADTNEKLNSVYERQTKVIGDTTNTISRNLMERERLNKAVREEYRDGEKVKRMIDDTVDSYQNQARELAKLKMQIDENKKSQKTLEDMYKAGKVTRDAYIERSATLIAKERELALSKSQLSQLMKIEEKLASDNAGSYNQLSHQLELLKNTYKDMSDTQKDSEVGREFERAIQDLDAHLKDLAADMGEFQRNVGNYAIAGQNGIVSTESLMAAMEREAVTMQDVADQSKILTEARGLLDTSDASYGETVSAINAKLEENRARLLDVSDIMEKQATSVAEAEAQNARLNEALKNVDLTSDEAKETISALTAKIDENDKIIKENSASQVSLKKDLKELVLEIANLSLEYQKLSEEEKASADGQELKSHIDGLIEKAGELKDAIKDTNEAITNAASDTRGFDQVGDALQVAIDGFGLATGAAAMLGISEGELAEIQTKLQACIAASNAMQSIQNKLQKQSALMQGVVTVQTKLRTVAENLQTAAQGRGVIATKALTAAQWAFNAAANANPIGLLIAGIAALVGLVWGLTKAFRAFTGSGDEAKEQCKSMRESIDEMSDAVDRQIERMKAMGATEAEILNYSIEQKKRVRDATKKYFETISQYYKEDSDEYKEALEAKKKADEDYQKSKEDGLLYLQTIIHDYEEGEKEQRLGTYEYKKQLILAELEQQKALALTLLEQEKITRQTYENIVNSLDKAANFKIAKLSETKTPSSSRANDKKKEAEELKKAVQAGEDALVSIIADSLERQTAAENLAYSRRLADLKAQLAKTKDTQVDLRTALNRQIEALETDHQRKLSEIRYSGQQRSISAELDLIESHLSVVKEGSQEELDWKIKQLKAQMNQELNVLAKAEDDKTYTAEQAAEMRANIAEKYAQMEEQAISDHADKEVEKIENKYSVEQIKTNNALSERANQYKREYADELEQAKGNNDRKIKAEQDYQRKMEMLQLEYARDTIKREIDMMKKMLAVANLSAEERLRIETALAAKESELDDVILQIRLKKLNDEDDKDNLFGENWKQRVAKGLEIAKEALNELNELMQSVFDSRIEKIDAELQANTDAGDKEKEQIQELVEKKVITEEEGEARKRAAEKKTARQNEELERKKAALQHKQAVYNKAMSAMNVGLETAVALMKLWDKPGWPAAIPMMAVVGALGAIQLATVLATPIPKYAKGTDYHAGGPAIVGDAGKHEVVMIDGAAWVTPDKPTLVDLPKGATVLPSANDVIPMNGLTLLPSMPTSANARPYDDAAMRRDVGELIRTVKMQTRQQHSDAYRMNYERFKNSVCL